MKTKEVIKHYIDGIYDGIKIANKTIKKEGLSIRGCSFRIEVPSKKQILKLWKQKQEKEAREE